MADSTEISERALELMQALASAYADGDVPEGPQRGIVGRRTAMDAVMQIYAILEEQLVGEQIPDEVGLHGVAMLMLIREYVLSLPDPPGDEAQLASDLRDLTRMLDEAWES
jgi:hypothetical protein